MSEFRVFQRSDIAGKVTMRRSAVTMVWQFETPNQGVAIRVDGITFNVTDSYVDVMRWLEGDH